MNQVEVVLLENLRTGSPERFNGGGCFSLALAFYILRGLHLRRIYPGGPQHVWALCPDGEGIDFKGKRAKRDIRRDFGGGHFTPAAEDASLSYVLESIEGLNFSKHTMALLTAATEEYAREAAIE